MALGKRRRAAWSPIRLDAHPLQPCWCHKNPSDILLPWFHVETNNLVSPAK